MLRCGPRRGVFVNRDHDRCRLPAREKLAGQLRLDFFSCGLDGVKLPRNGRSVAKTPLIFNSIDMQRAAQSAQASESPRAKKEALPDRPARPGSRHGGFREFVKTFEDHAASDCTPVIDREDCAPVSALRRSRPYPSSDQFDRLGTGTGGRARKHRCQYHGCRTRAKAVTGAQRDWHTPYEHGRDKMESGPSTPAISFPVNTGVTAQPPPPGGWSACTAPSAPVARMPRPGHRRHRLAGSLGSSQEAR